jgi:hypothetical protein
VALPTLYIDTGGHALGSGSTDTANPTHDSTTNGVTVSVTGTTVTFSGAIDLSAVPTDGSATIWINDATNSNAKIFKITAVDDGLDTVTVSVAPTGTIATSTWGIGGRFVYDSARFEGSLAAGWTVVINNTPAAKSAVFFTARTFGDLTDGPITLMGKTGVRPQLSTDTSQVIASSSSTNNRWVIKNLELMQTGGSGTVVGATATGNRWIYDNVKFSDGSGNIINTDANGCTVQGCEFTGVGSTAITTSADGWSVVGTYIHDVGAGGVVFSSATVDCVVSHCIIDTCGSQGISLTSAAVTTTVRLGLMVLSCTIYGCGNSGIEVADADQKVMLTNNILQDNGNAAGEFNLEFAAGNGDWNSFHAYNIFYHQGGGGGGNLSNVTANSTESTSAPQFTDAANGDFSLASGSPAIATGFPGQFLGGPLGYLDMGAVQVEASAAGAESTPVAVGATTYVMGRGQVVTY